jgi:hypothetical protein
VSTAAASGLVWRSVLVSVLVLVAGVVLVSVMGAIVRCARVAGDDPFGHVDMT